MWQICPLQKESGSGKYYCMPLLLMRRRCCQSHVVMDEPLSVVIKSYEFLLQQTTINCSKREFLKMGSWTQKVQRPLYLYHTVPTTGHIRPDWGYEGLCLVSFCVSLWSFLISLCLLTELWQTGNVKGHSVHRASWPPGPLGLCLVC